MKTESEYTNKTIIIKSYKKEYGIDVDFFVTSNDYYPYRIRMVNTATSEILPSIRMFNTFSKAIEYFHTLTKG